MNNCVAIENIQNDMNVVSAPLFVFQLFPAFEVVYAIIYQCRVIRNSRDGYMDDVIT